VESEAVRLGGCTLIWLSRLAAILATLFLAVSAPAALPAEEWAAFDHPGKFIIALCASDDALCECAAQNTTSAPCFLSRTEQQPPRPLAPRRAGRLRKGP
jgi:hypothetical protein